MGLHSMFIQILTPPNKKNILYQRKYSKIAGVFLIKIRILIQKTSKMHLGTFKKQKNHKIGSIIMTHVIILTGAGKGIGKAIALEFAARAKNDPDFNPSLTLCSRSPEDLAALTEQCRSAGIKTLSVVADIARREDRERLVEQTILEFGTIDCLINNAGVGRFKNFTELSEEDFDYTMSVNTKGTFFLTQKVFPVMEKKRSGHIFFITSIAAETAFKSSAIYSMSKFAQKGLVESLRLYGRECNVRITNVMPGAVFTPMWGEAGEDLKNVMMMPEDIAGPIVDAYLQPARTSVEEIVLRPVGGDINE